MFKQTRRRLILVNSIVLLVILLGFGTFLYTFMQHRLYSQADETLQHVKRYILQEQQEGTSEWLQSYDDNYEQRTVLLLWGKKGELDKELPENVLNDETIGRIGQLPRTDALQSLEVERAAYRVLEVPMGQQVTVDHQSMYVERVQLVYNLVREHEMLEHLRRFIGFGSLVSLAVAVLAGFFLAHRALIPIQSAWNRQSQFTADASHELRTPLAVMKLNLERLFRHPKHTIEQESPHISQAISEIKYMTRMVTQLLTLAQSDANQLELKLSPVDLSSLLEKTARGFAELAESKGILVTAAVEPGIEISGDPERLYQLLVILLDNALRYTPNGGRIQVEASVRGGQIYTSVRDTGSGIPPEDMPRIFDRFYRGNKARTRQGEDGYEGTGLGLSIARWIVEQHGGRIRVSSQLGAGSQFTIQFPMGRKRMSD
ncbi:HAMP domain-containing sensor histidine kinase [Paenibacillus sp. JX-17]|uniref:histidine kinase n=1 Tax=Paenibacillus lacisoli TaxID=3064525 RepID=A0ABT9CCA3_9BACL|nr:HAMP domain-containing sensor histidine kinase [Paenibacillus sp. JX-17]MDO7906279.1 HAMP domain-containing sensor histidine kinase [Paenibacillus sp. JX-17]